MWRVKPSSDSFAPSSATQHARAVEDGCRGVRRLHSQENVEDGMRVGEKCERVPQRRKRRWACWAGVRVDTAV